MSSIFLQNLFLEKKNIKGTVSQKFRPQTKAPLEPPLFSAIIASTLFKVKKLQTWVTVYT